MPIKRTYTYTAGGKTYEIPEKERNAFEKDFPDASIRMYGGGKTYDIPLGDVDEFIGDFPDGSFDVKEEVDEGVIGKMRDKVSNTLASARATGEEAKKNVAEGQNTSPSPSAPQAKPAKRINIPNSPMIPEQPSVNRNDWMIGGEQPAMPETQKEATQLSKQARSRNEAAQSYANRDWEERMNASNEAAYAEAVRKESRKKYDDEHFEDFYQTSVAPQFEASKAEAEKSAESKIVVPNPYSTGDFESFMNQVAIERETDPAKVTANVISNMDQGALGNYVFGRMGIKTDEDTPEGYVSVPMTEGEKAVMERLISDETNEVVTELQNRMYEEYKKASAPQSVLDYILGSAFHNNIAARLNKAMVQNAAESSGIREQLRQMAEDEYGKGQSWGTRAVANTAPFAVDVATGGFTLPSMAGQAVKTGLLSAAARRGLSAAAAEATERYLIQRAPALMAGINAISGMANFGTLGVQSEAIRQLGEGNFDGQRLINAFIEEAPLGGALAIGGALGYMTRNSGNVVKAVSDIGGLAAETSAFAAASGIREAINEGIDVYDVDWGRTFGDAAGMVIGMKSTGALMNPVSTARNLRNRYYSSKKYNVDLNQYDVDNLKENGYDLSDIFKGMRAVADIATSEPKTIRRKTEVESVDGTPVEGLENVEVDPSMLEEILNNPNITSDAKRKIVYLANGRILMPEKVYNADAEVNGDVMTITRYNAAGDVIGREDVSVGDGERILKGYKDEGRSNTVEAIEKIVSSTRLYQRQAEEEWYRQNGFDTEASKGWVEARASQIAQERAGRLKASAAYDVSEKTGIDIDEVLAKNPSERTPSEDAAVDLYIKNLQDLFSQDMSRAEIETADYAGAAISEGVQEGRASMGEGGDPHSLKLNYLNASANVDEGVMSELDTMLGNEEDSRKITAYIKILPEGQQEAAIAYVRAESSMRGIENAIDGEVETAVHNERNRVSPAVYVPSGTDSPVLTTAIVDGKEVYLKNYDPSSPNVQIADLEEGKITQEQKEHIGFDESTVRTVGYAEYIQGFEDDTRTSVSQRAMMAANHNRKTNLQMEQGSLINSENGQMYVFSNDGETVQLLPTKANAETNQIEPVSGQPINMTVDEAVAMQDAYNDGVDYGKPQAEAEEAPVEEAQQEELEESPVGEAAPVPANAETAVADIRTQMDSAGLSEAADAIDKGRIPSMAGMTEEQQGLALRYMDAVNALAEENARRAETQTAAAEPAKPTIPVDKKTGVKLYEQGVELDDAIEDIKKDGFTVSEVADISIAEAQKELEKVQKKVDKGAQTREELYDSRSDNPKTEYGKSLKRAKELQGVIDYYTRLKAREEELGKPAQEELENVAKAAAEDTLPKAVEETHEEGASEQPAAETEAATPVEETQEETKDPLIEAYEREQDTVDTEGGLVGDEVAEHALPENWRGALHSLGRHIGRRIVILSDKSIRERGYDPDKVSGYAQGNTVYISERAAKDNGRLRSFIAGHELTHMLKKESPEVWNAFVQSVKTAMGDDFAEEFAAVKKKYDDFYDAYNEKAEEEGRKKLTKLTDDEIDEEVCCNWAGRHMLQDEEAVRNIVEEAANAGADPKSLIKKVLDWINGMLESLKTALKRGEDVADSIDAFNTAKKIWQDMYNIATAKNNARKEAEAKRMEEEENIPKGVAEELASHGLTVSGGAVMSTEAKELKDKTGYETPNETTEEDATKFSIATMPNWIKSFSNGDGKLSKKRVKEITGVVDLWYQMAAADDAIHDYISYGKYPGGDLNKDGKGPLRKNVEYVYTFDLDTTCPRTFQYLNYVDAIEAQLGRPMSQREMIILIESMRAMGQQIPCTYCYAENKRQALKQYYLNFIGYRNNVLNAKSDEEAKKAMYGLNSKGEMSEAAQKVFERWRGDDPLNSYRPSISQLVSHFNQARNIVLSDLDMLYEANAVNPDMSDAELTELMCERYRINQSTHAKAQAKSISEIINEWRYDTIEGTPHKNFTEMSGMHDFNLNALALWDEMRKYGASASSAKNVVKYYPYTDELQGISKKDRDYINGMGGLRMHSTNDFRIDYVGDYFQLLADMAKGGWMGHTYTKNPDFVRIFGNTGYRINMSIAAYDIDGKVEMNQEEGFNWEEVRKLREQFPNAGTMFMTTSRNQLQYALDADWVDMIIPFHASGLPKEVWYNMRKWEDATRVQNESFFNSKDKKDRLQAKGVDISNGASAEEIDKLYDKTFKPIKLYDNTAEMKYELKEAGQKVSQGISYDELKKQYIDYFGHPCKAKGKRIRPHFLPGETKVGGNTIPGWHVKGETEAQGTKRYLELCEQYGVRPRFYGVKVNDKEGNEIDVTEHPNYVKLIKETSRMDTEQTPIEFNLDKPNPALDEWTAGKNESTGESWTPMEYAMAKLREFAQQGGYSNLKEDPYGVVDDFMKNVVDYERETGKQRPLDYISPDARMMWNIIRKGAEAAAMSEDELMGDVPYHPADNAEPRFSLSTEIEAQYPNWMDNQTPEVEGKRGQNTQVAGTVGTYKKVGKWIEDNLGKDAKILDASSGLGLGTLELRKQGFDVEDIEPYPGKGRDEQPTYGGLGAYQRAMDDGKQYDYIISNAVLNVIPDDWRNGVLHDMATLLKEGGRMFINTRKAGEEKTIKNKIELESPQEVLVGTPEKITSYQRFFTPQELKKYVQDELGEGYTVTIANEKNSGTKGLAAVVVTKESPDGGKKTIQDLLGTNKEEPRFSLRGEVGAANDPDAMANLSVAKDMDKEKRSAKSIWLSTGWEKGADGKWRNEIPDVKAKPLDFDNVETIEDIVDAPELFAAYPQLKEYKVQFTKMKNAGSINHDDKLIKLDKEYNTDYSLSDEDQQELNERTMDYIKNGNWRGEGDIVRFKRNWVKKHGTPHIDKEGIKTIAHELQHAVQGIEGFARGGSVSGMAYEYLKELAEKDPELSTFAKEFADFMSVNDMMRSGKKAIANWLSRDDMDADDETKANLKKVADSMRDMSDAEFVDYIVKAKQLAKQARKVGEERYDRLAGEIEAKNVEDRLDMTDEERRSTPPSETEDLSRENQVVRFSISEEEETEYDKAVKDGDIEKAGEIWRDVVAKAMPNTKVLDEDGKPLVMSHHTDAQPFNKFDRSKIGTGQGQAFLGLGFNFSRGRGDSTYGSRNVQAYLNAENPLRSDKSTLSKADIRSIIEELNKKNGVDRIEDSWGSMRDAVDSMYDLGDDLGVYATIGMTYSGDRQDVMESFEKRGFDSTIEYYDDGRIHNAVVFNSNQIKLADPITYDDDNNPIPLEQRANMSDDDIRFSLADDEQSKEIFDASKKLFGTTRDVREAGYVLPDGSMLDFSGRHLMNPGSDTSFLRGRRTTDHREISSIAYEKDGNTKTGVDTDMSDFIRRGAIRIDDNAGLINLSNKPTTGQKEILRRLIARNDGYVQVDFGDGWDSEHYVEYNGDKPSKVISDIDKYYDEGIKPQPRFSLSDTPFYSNAEKAVDDIKQEKATPEQWLKMIEKAGGLKAGEDKWMGLSDWLKGQDKKSLTKQEVMDFIRENQIQIEEVKYSDKGSQDPTLRYEEEFRDLIAEAPDEVVEEGDEEQWAWEQMIDQYGEDFGKAFDYDGDNIFARTDDTGDNYLYPELVKKYWGDRAINSTRLNYTTKGLKNKKEIALVVPTIEPYNESDDIHFGDAGNGRAVAWIRFGETTDKDGNKVLVIDEIQSKRHQEGREKGYKGDAIAENKAKAEEMRKRHQELVSKRDELIDRDQEIREAIRNTDKAKAMIGEDGYIMQDKVDEWQSMFDSNEELEEVYRQRGAIVRELQDLEQDMRALDKDVFGKVPDAPFEKNWHELAMKRMLRYAAENGYDKVAWTNGEQQADRYDIGNIVRWIGVKPKEKSNKEVVVELSDGTMYGMDIDAEGNIESENPAFNGKKASEIFGKELAQKIMAVNETTTFKDTDLRIGAEGMKGFYDQMLPRFMDKYGKKWGLKTGEVELPGLEKSARKMWAVDVTPEMKESVMQGQPMFSLADEDRTAVESYDAGEPTFVERITNSLIELQNRNAENTVARMNAISSIGARISDINKAMRAQKEYDKGTVDSLVRLAKMLLAQTKTMLKPDEQVKIWNALAKVVGKKDTTEEANRVVDVLVDSELRTLKGLLDKIRKTKGVKLNSSGVETMGRLDIIGQRLVNAFNDGLKMKEDDLQNRIAETNMRLYEADSPTTRESIDAELRGQELAQRYHEEIGGAESTIAGIRSDINTAKEDPESVGISKGKERADYIRGLQQRIRDEKISAIPALASIVAELSEEVKAGKTRAKMMRDEDLARKQEIWHDANSDLLGVPNDSGAHKKTVKEKWAENRFLRLALQPLATFNEMLRFFGESTVRGEGRLFNRFMPQFIGASDREWRRMKENRRVIDEKLSDIMGKKTEWSDLYRMESKMPTVPVTVKEGKEEKTYDLTQGNMLYIYMANKMTDGKVKLRKMGISEEDVEALKEKIDPRFIELADWIQSEFLPSKRKEFNEVHERMYGAPMADIEDYFPLEIDKNARASNFDVKVGNSNEHKPSTVTGSVIKRTFNTVALDITRADAFDVLYNHLQDMEHWAAFAEFSRDLNTLINYPNFKKKVKNMSSLRFGSGEQILKTFEKVAQIASGSYTPTVDRGSLDSLAVNIGKGVTMSKISFRLFTAMKQLLSAPAYISEASPASLAKYGTPVMWASNFNWAVENVPGFSKRWESRQAGDYRLKRDDLDWTIWNTRLVDKLSKWGMTPNAFVDALTVAIGARAIYETNYKRMMKDGYDRDIAHQRALEKATSYNETQQSSENAYLAPIQVDRTAASVTFTAFRNASMGYERRLARAVVDLRDRMKSGYKDRAVEQIMKQAMKDGLNEDQARKSAERIYDRGRWRDIADVAIFGYGLQFLWNLGPYIVDLLFGDDDDKEKALKDAAIHALFGPIEGLTGGNVVSDGINNIINGEWYKVLNSSAGQMPIVSDIKKVMQDLQKDEYAAIVDIVHLLMSSTVGVNPANVSDWTAAIMDAGKGLAGEDGDNLKASEELTLLLLRLAEVPKSQTDKFFLDRVFGESPRDVDPERIDAMLKRYTDYKRNSTEFLLRPVRDLSDEGREKIEDKWVKRFETERKERMKALANEDDAALIEKYEKEIRSDLIKKGKDDRTAEEDDLYDTYNEYKRYFKKGTDESERPQSSVDSISRVLAGLIEKYIADNGEEE